MIQESPFMPGVFLTVGDWTFNLWKEGTAPCKLRHVYPACILLQGGMRVCTTGVPEPLFSSPYSSRYLMTGCWSPTRPG